MSTTYKEYRTEDDKPILVEAARRDGAGKNIQNNYAKQVGYYGAMGVGKSDEAKSLETAVGVEDETPFSNATVGINSDVTTGMQQLKKLVGIKLAKNQWVYNWNFTSDGGGWTAYAGTTGTVTFENNVGKAVFHGEKLASGQFQFYTHINCVAGHIYLLKCKMRINALRDGTLCVASYGVNYQNRTYAKEVNKWIDTCMFFTKQQSTNGLEVGAYYISSNIEDGDSLELKEFCCYDLTQMFGNNTIVNAILGNGNDDEKFANLMLFLGGWLPTTYDTGSFTDCKSAKLKTIDYNLCKEQWKQGDWNNPALSTRVTATNDTRIKLEAGKTYLFKKHTGEDYGFSAALLEEIDSTSYFSTIPWTSTQALYTPDRDCYVAVVFGKGSNWSANITPADVTRDVKFSVSLYWDGSKTDYEPYAEHEIELPNKDLNGILCADGDGNLYADGDELYPNAEGNKKRYAKVRLGSLVWTWETSNNRFYATLPYKAGGESNTTYNWIFGNVRISNTYDNKGNQDDKSFFIYMGSAQKSIYICDSAYAGDASALQTALANVYVIYELDESEQEELEAEQYPENFYGDDFGIMMFLDENNNVITGLQGCEMFYKANVAGFAESLGVKANWDPDYFMGQEDKTALDAKDNQIIAAVGGTLRNCLAVKESLNFRDTDVLDLSIFDWTYEAANHRFYTRTSNNIMKAAATSATKAKILCTEYENTDSGTASSNPAYNCIALDNSNPNPYIIIHDSRFENASQLKAALKNVLLAYEKASS